MIPFRVSGPAHPVDVEPEKLLFWIMRESSYRGILRRQRSVSST